MNKIATFEIDHTQLKPGVYVSRQDQVGDAIITTLDVRFKKPYKEPPLTPEILHTIEHLGAVYLREQSSWASRVLYWGPMGCQTGFDLLVVGDVSVGQIVPTLYEMCLFITSFEGKIPGAQFAWQCGNYQLHDLAGARQEAKKFAENLAAWKEENSFYPRRTN